jgi:hypothetical protein
VKTPIPPLVILLKKPDRYHTDSGVPRSIVGISSFKENISDGLEEYLQSLRILENFSKVGQLRKKVSKWTRLNLMDSD